jgi:beta-xylosidase
VLSGRVNPSGRLPVHVPATAGGQPWTYLAASLGRLNSGSMLDPTPAFPFGHGIGYGQFAWSDASVSAATMATDGSVDVSVTLTNGTERDGADVVQLYLHDPVAQVVRPEQRLIGFARVELAAGESARLSFRVSADLASFTGRAGHRIVEPGTLVLGVARSVADIVFALDVELTGAERAVDHTRAMEPEVAVTRLP